MNTAKNLIAKRFNKMNSPIKANVRFFVNLITKSSGMHKSIGTTDLTEFKINRRQKYNGFIS